MSDRKMTEAQRAYETKRAKKAGMSLDKWMADKDKRAAAEAREEAATAPKAAAAVKKPGFFGRLLEKAQKPI
jgi:capsid protein